MTGARKMSRKPATAAKRSTRQRQTLPETPLEIAPSVDAAPEAAVVSLPATARPSPAGLRLETSCTLRDSIDMHFQLLAVDFGDSDVLVDGSAVERIDTTGLQLLLSFARHQASRGKSLHWTAVSPELMRGSQLLGLTTLLGLPESGARSQASGN